MLEIMESLLCFYNVEKAFDSVELPTLPKEMYNVRHWYKWQAMALVLVIFWKSKTTSRIPWSEAGVGALTCTSSYSNGCSLETYERVIVVYQLEALT